MAAKGINVKIVDEIKRLQGMGFGKRKIARTLNIHRDTVSKTLEKNPLENLALSSPLPQGKPITIENVPSDSWTDKIDWQAIRAEVLLGVSLNVIHDEMVKKHSLSIQYPAFWKQLQKRAPTTSATMIRVFAPGSRTEIDYADGINLIDLTTGEITKTQFFVGVLCNSRYTFAEFTLSQKSSDFLSSHVRMFNFFGGCTQLLSPDNLKSAVTKAHRYDPVINPAYSKLAAHYEVAVVPARVRTPKDKAIVERTIQIFQRWFFMCVRKRVFTSLVELNKCLEEYLKIFNKKLHRIFGRSREQMFESERPHLLPLPMNDYQVSTYAKAKLSRDCHLQFDQNYYSAPHMLRDLHLEVWASATSIEIFHENNRVAFHGRSKTTHKFITDPKHYPPGHQAYAEEDITKLKAWATSIGTETSKLIDELLSGSYPLKHFRRAQGVLAISTKYSKSDLESAAIIANKYGQKNIQFLERVIKNKQHDVQIKGEKKIIREANPNLRGVDNILLN